MEVSLGTVEEESGGLALREHEISRDEDVIGLLEAPRAPANITRRTNHSAICRGRRSRLMRQGLMINRCVL